MFKLCFSTVGCPHWRWQEITACALDLGFQGIELRGLGDDLTLTEVSIFQPGNVGKTHAGLQNSGISIPCVATDCLLHDKAFALSDAGRYIELAKALHAPYLRVLCDEWGHPGENVDEALCEERLRALIPDAEKAGVILLVETNGVWADTKRLRGLMDRIDHPAAGVLWDINHPVRYFNETAGETYENIGKYVRHVHIKDSVTQDGKLVYKMLGYGDLPIRETLSLLKNGGYDGYLSMEWVKRWNSELEEPGVVFAHFAYQMKKMIAEA